MAKVESIPVDQCICGEQVDPTQEVCFATTHRSSEQQRLLREAYAQLERSARPYREPTDAADVVFVAAWQRAEQEDHTPEQAQMIACKAAVEWRAA